MAESAHHEFLKDSFNSTLEKFSSTKLYSVTECERKKFDFASVVERDWKRELVGQVLWRHYHGIEKDLRTLFTDEDSAIKVYIASDTAKHRATFYEIVNDFRTSNFDVKEFKLKSIWVPNDFDIKQEAHRETVSKIIEEQVVNDILFNVIFSKISAENVEFLLTASSRPHYHICVLYRIAVDGFVSESKLISDCRLSRTRVKESIQIFVGAGFLIHDRSTSSYRESHRGKLFLDLLGRLKIEISSHGSPSNELAFILDRLGCNSTHYSISLNRDKPPTVNSRLPTNYDLLMICCVMIAEFQIDLGEVDRSKAWINRLAL